MTIQLSGEVLSPETVTHIPKFGGKIWYVNAGSGNDTNNIGRRPSDAFATIGAAITAASAGDAVNVKAGTYTESVAVNKTALELWGEIGAIIVGTVTISSDSCRFESFIVNPASGNAINLTGNRAKIEDVQAVAGVIGFNIDGYQNIFADCIASGYSATGYDIANYNNLLTDCLASGAKAGTRGFYLSNTAADSCSLVGCASTANDTAGFEIVANCTYNTFRNCMSGGGDGIRVDSGTNTVWANYAPHHHTPLFGGNVWYVSTGTGVNTNDGQTPSSPVATISAAVTLATAGDAINIKAGTYAENIVVPVAKEGLEFWGEVGAIIDPASGIGILTQAPYCIFKNLIVDPYAGAVGIHIDSGAIWNDFYDVRIKPGSSTGYDIDAAGCRFERCNAAAPASGGYGFDIDANSTKMRDCLTAGTSGVATTGYYVRSGIKGLLDNCSSVEHSNAGFNLATGVCSMIINNCSSGGGDGRWVDADNANTWPGFTFNNKIFKSLTLDADATTKQYNLYEVTGIVQIDLIYAHVEATLSTNHTNCHIDLYDGSAVVLSDATGLTLSDAPVGSLIIRNSDVANVLGYSSGANAFLSENANYRDPQKPFIVGQKGDGTATYIRFVHTTTDSISSGTLHFHVQYTPISDDGFLEAV